MLAYTVGISTVSACAGSANSHSTSASTRLNHFTFFMRDTSLAINIRKWA